MDFAGVLLKCESIIRINHYKDQWVIEGTALKGSRPAGSDSHYVYRTVIGGGDLPAGIIKDVVSAGNGKSLDWTAYPYAPAGQAKKCYTGSIIHEEGTPGNQSFSLKIPREAPCEEIQQK